MRRVGQSAKTAKKWAQRAELVKTIEEMNIQNIPCYHNPALDIYFPFAFHLILVNIHNKKSLKLLRSHKSYMNVTFFLEPFAHMAAL